MPPERKVVRTLEDFEARARAGKDLGGLVVQGVDLTATNVDWSSLELGDSLFLGCHFPAEAVEAEARAHGALIFPPFQERPYDPFRNGLYTPEELNAPLDWDGATKSRDEHINDWYVAAGKYLPDVGEALAQRVHDLAIDEALGELIGDSPEARLKRRIVGIMGGHSIGRNEDAYWLAAETMWDLGKDHLVVTGGGPGIMEAGNLGAAMSERPAAELDAALTTLAEAPTAKDPRYAEVADAVRRGIPNPSPNLSVPTWFYGFEPSNRFATEIAKYFSNSLREDGLLAICLHGIVYGSGAAGTSQEIFTDAAQNQYSTFGYRSPMAFLGRARYEPSKGEGLYPTLAREAADFATLLELSDSPARIASFIREHAPDA